MPSSVKGLPSATFCTLCYTLICRQMVDDMCSVPWHLVIWDEAHMLKNEKTKLYKAAVRLPTRLRYGRTGTPMQNDYKELW